MAEDSREEQVSRMRIRAETPPDLGELVPGYRNYLRTLTRLQLGTRLRGKADDSDIVQETLLRATAKLDQFRGTTEDELIAWLRQVLSSVIANSVRHYYGTSRRDIRVEKSLEAELTESSSRLRNCLADRGASPSARASSNEEVIRLSDALAQLPNHYRDVIELRQIQQLSFAEVAVTMNRSVDSVRSLWPRALAELRRVMEAQA